MEAWEYAVNASFLIGGLALIVVTAILWFTVLRKKTKRQYPLPQMLGVAFVAQAIGTFAFFS